MWECVVGEIFGSHLLVRHQIEHFFKLLTIHKNVSVQEGVSTNVTCESNAIKMNNIISM